MSDNNDAVEVISEPGALLDELVTLRLKLLGRLAVKDLASKDFIRAELRALLEELEKDKPVE